MRTRRTSATYRPALLVTIAFLLQLRWAAAGATELHRAQGTSGNSLGYLLSRTRVGLVTLGLLSYSEAQNIHIDTSKDIAIPGQKTTRGYVVRLDSKADPIGYVEVSSGGHLSCLYDKTGAKRGNPAGLVGITRRSVVTLGLATSNDLDDLHVNFSEEVAIPSGDDGDRGFVVSLRGRAVAYVKTTASGLLAAVYDSSGTPRGNPELLLTRTRAALGVAGLATKKDAKRIHIDLSKKVAIPDANPSDPRQKEIFGYAVTLGDKTVAYVSTTSAGDLASLYGPHGTALAHPARLLSQTRGSLVALGWIKTDQSKQVHVDFSSEIAIPGSAPGRKETFGYPVTLNGKTLAYVKTSATDDLPGLYGARGEALGNPRTLLSQTRSSLVAMGWVNANESGRIRIDLSSELPIPGSGPPNKEALGFPVTLDERTLGYVSKTRGGRLASFYDSQGHALGVPATLLAQTRRNLVALGLVEANDAKHTRVDLSKQVEVPGLDGVDGYMVTLLGKALAFVKTTPSGHISTMFDGQGNHRGDPDTLLGQAKGSLKALGLIDANESRHVRMDLRSLVEVPNRKEARGYQLTLRNDVLGYIEPNTGGHLSTIYDSAGVARGTPAALTSQVNTSLRLLGLVDKNTSVDIDLTGKGPYPVTLQGNVIAFAHPAKGGSLSRLSDGKNGNNWGNPTALCREFLWCVRLTEGVDLKNLPLLKIDFGPVVSGENAKELAVNDSAGKTKYYVVPHPMSGHMVKVLDENRVVLFERQPSSKFGVKFSRAGFRRAGK